METLKNIKETPVWRDNRAVALLMAATLTVMANATISPALPGLQRLFSADPNAAVLTRLLVTAPSLSIALLAPLAGVAVDRFGRRLLLIAGIMLFVVSGTAGVYLPNLTTIFISRMVLGVAVALIMTAQTALIGDYFSGEARSALSGLQISARNFGGLVFILLAGFVAATSPRWAFGVYGLAVLVLPLTWIAIVEPERPSLSREGGRPAEVLVQSYWAMPFMGLVFVQSLTNMLFFIMPTQLPFFLESQGYHSATRTGLTLSVLMLTGGCTALFYTRSQRVLGYAGVFTVGYAAMSFGFLLLMLSPPAWLTFAGAAAIGAGYALVSPGFVAITLKLAPAPRRGLAGGILTASVFFGQFCSPLISTSMVFHYGYGGLLASVAVLLAAMAAVALSIRS